MTYLPCFLPLCKGSGSVGKRRASLLSKISFPSPFKERDTKGEIEQLLNINYSLNNIGFKIVECSNLSFSITYHWKYKFRPLYRFSFFTTLVDEERYFLTYFLNSIPYLGRSHTVTIEGFNGDLFVVRFFRPIKLLTPLAQFCFWGEYEEVTIIK